MSSTEIKPEIMKLSKHIQKDIKVNGDGSIDIGENMFNDSLSTADLKPEDVSRVQKHSANMLAAVGLVIGQQATPMMIRDAELSRVAGATSFGQDRVTFQYDRSRAVTNPANAAEPITQHGALTVKYKVQGSGDTNALKTVKQHLMAEAEKAFK